MYAEVLSPRISEFVFIWKQDGCRCNELRWSHTGSGPVSLSEDGHVNTHTGRRPRGRGSLKPGSPEMASKPPATRMSPPRVSGITPLPTS